MKTIKQSYRELPIQEGQMSAPITLGRLIKLLELEPQDNDVRYDFARFTPTEVDSYRGYYEQLAIGWTGEAKRPKKVSELIEELKDAVGETFTGYKGGKFKMDDNTPVWCANYGDCHDTAITGLENCSWATVIRTEFYNS